MERGKYQVHSFICEEKHGETAFIHLDENTVVCSKCYEETLLKGRENAEEIKEGRTKIKEIEPMKPKKSKELRRLRVIFIGIEKELVVEKWEKVMSVSNLTDYAGQGFVILLGHKELLPESPLPDYGLTLEGDCCHD